MKTVVISLGGSLIVPEAIDEQFLLQLFPIGAKVSHCKIADEKTGTGKDLW